MFSEPQPIALKKVYYMDIVDPVRLQELHKQALKNLRQTEEALMNKRDENLRLKDEKMQMVSYVEDLLQMLKNLL